jgi:hypothetical protein
LYFEGGSPDAEIEAFMSEETIPEQAHLALGTLWPRPRIFHVLPKAIPRLAKIMEHHAEPELAVHFHVYRRGEMLLEWYDAFSQAMRVSGSVPEDQVQALAQALGTSYRREELTC